MTKRKDHNIEVPTGSLRLKTLEATAWLVVEYYRERPLWRKAALALLVFSPIIGYLFVGVWGIVAGLAFGVVADLIGPLGRKK
jgi:hypothetical protein